MSLGSKIESLTKKLTKSVIQNTHGMPYRTATSFIGMMIAGGIGVVAFKDPSFVNTVQQTLGGNSLEVGSKFSQALFQAGSIGGAISLSAMGVSKLFKEPIKAIERWANNNPADIIKKASWKEMQKDGNGQAYIQDRLNSMNAVDRKALSDYVDSRIEVSKELHNGALTQQGVDVKPGFIAYDKAIKAEMANEPGQSAKHENGRKDFQTSTDFSF